MTNTTDTTLTAPSRRAGFTLIELLIVIVIIGILAAVLLPAISNVRTKTQEAKVVADIKTLDTAITNFQSQYGVIPPSFIVLYEQGDVGTNSANPSWYTDTNSQLPSPQNNYRITSRAIIKRIWPTFDFSYAWAPAASPNAIDINGNGTTNDVLVLNGAECLAFFLGGIPERVDSNGDGAVDSWAGTGFAANPLAPFMRRTAAASRVGPFHEFQISRFIDIDSARGLNTTELMPEYLDTLPNQQIPYQYFSAYDGRGYQPLGQDGALNTGDDERLPATLGLYAHYVQEAPSTKPLALAQPYSPKTYQIISPGYDGEFGIGGFYNNQNITSEDTNGNGMLDPGEDINGNGVLDNRANERDNITSFKGRLN